MPPITVHTIASVGVVKDTAPHLLPPEVWSDSRNVRFRDGIAVKFLVHENVFRTPTVAPKWAVPVTDPTTVFWVYSNLAKVYATDGVAHAVITRAVGGDY